MSPHHFPFLPASFSLFMSFLSIPSFYEPFLEQKGAKRPHQFADRLGESIKLCGVLRGRREHRVIRTRWGSFIRGPDSNLQGCLVRVVGRLLVGRTESTFKCRK